MAHGYCHYPECPDGDAVHMIYKYEGESGIKKVSNTSGEELGEGNGIFWNIKR